MEANTIEQLLQSIKNSTSPFDKVGFLNNLAWKYKELSNYDDVKLISEQVLDLLKEYPNDFQYGRILNTLGVMYLDNGKFLQSNETLKQAYDLFVSVDNKEFQAVTLCNIGATLRSRAKYIEAIEYLSKSIRIAEDYNFSHVLVSSLLNVGNTYRNLKQFSIAIEYYNRALDISTSKNDKYGISSVYSNLGNVYSDLNQNEIALNYLFQALEINERLDDKSGVAIDLGNIGNIYFNILDYHNAIEYYLRSLSISEQLGNSNSTAIKYVNLGVVYGTPEFEGYNFEVSIGYFQKGLSLSLETENLYVQSLIHKNFADVYKFEKKWEEYSYNYEKFHEIHSKINTNKVLEYTKEYDFERKQAEREKELAIINAKANERSKILEDILPKEIINRLINGETKIADTYDNVSLLFLDIVGFTQLTETVSAIELVDILDKIFGKFDSICKKYSVEKIKTIGDAYLAVAGATIPSDNPSLDVANVACEIQAISINDLFNSSNVSIQFRIGLHRGNIVAGIIGEEKYSYDIWGDSVNIASRMESHSEPGKIHISEQFEKSIVQYPEFKLIQRGEISIKGKGTMNTFWLERAE
jgi:adenylate cyclase